MPRIIESHTSVTMTPEGEVITATTDTTKRWGKEPPYVKMYLDNLLFLKDLPKGHSGILNELLNHMAYSSSEKCQKIYMNAELKREIADKIGVSTKRIENVIIDLADGGLLIRAGRGTYQVNPNFFGKGDWRNIAELRMQITFNGEGTTIMTEIEKHKEENKKAKNVVIPGQVEFEVSAQKNSYAMPAKSDRAAS